jgi:hypothetical protein
MSYAAERSQVGAARESDVDGLLTRYMRELLRGGEVSYQRIDHMDDVRTCTHCGAHVRFSPVDQGWAACSACGHLA